METRTPTVQLNLNGKDLESTMKCRLTRIQAELSMDGESSALAVVSGGYPIGNNNLLLPGGQMELWMGYETERSLVFSGYLEQVALEADKDHSCFLNLRAYDAIRLMKETKSCRIIMEKKHSDVFKKVVSAYFWTGIDVQCRDTKPLDGPKFWFQQESDYEFIQRVLIERYPGDWEFYLSAGVVYYKPVKNESPVLEISLSSGIFRLLAARSFLNQTVKIYGNSPLFSTFTGTAEVKGRFLWEGAGKGTEALASPDAQSQDMADAMALGRAKRLERESCHITVVLGGNSKLIPGAYVQVKEIDSMWDGSYRIRKAVHSFDENGYRTEVILEGS